jgi:lysophospholipase L1-like esterase
MDASAWNQGSLPEFLAREYNNLGRTNLILNISTSGHTLTRIVDMMNADFVWWLNQQTYDGILFSAGGNDFIDAARDAPPGQGLLHDMHGKPVPTSAYDCVRQDALKVLRAYLNDNFGAIYLALRNSKKNAATSMYLNCYDTPVARDAPAFRNFAGPWLYTAYQKNGIDASIWEGLTEAIFKDIKDTIQGWTIGRTNVVAVNTSGRLDKADPNATGDSFDWINEIHPNKSGWKKQVPAWLAVLPE